MTAGDEANVDGPNSYRSYRGAIQPLMTGAGYTVDYIGTRSTVPAVGGDPDHDGYGGARFSTSDNNFADRLPAIVAAAGALNAIVIFIGWNDIYGEPEGIADRWTAFVQSVRASVPGVPLVLCTISPQRGETEAQTNANVPGYSALNTRIRATPATVANTRVADLAAGGFVSADYKDAIHFLQAGADRAAAIIAPQLQAALGAAGGVVTPPGGNPNFLIPNRPRVLTVTARTTGGSMTVAGSGTTPAAPAINTVTITGGQVGVFYSVTLSITGTPAPSVSVTTGTLPAGLSLSGSTISGTPTTAG
jgi:lysophospholipase L1-like esterase